jgi:hypothetical protein
VDPPSIADTTEAPPTPLSIMIVWSDGAITGVPMERDIKP